MSCPAECCVHECLLCFKVRVFEALGEQNRCMPIFACHFAHALRLVALMGLAKQLAKVNISINLVVALRVPNFEVTRVAHEYHIFVYANRLTLVS